MPQNDAFTRLRVVLIRTEEPWPGLFHPARIDATSTSRCSSGPRAASAQLVMSKSPQENGHRSRRWLGQVRGRARPLLFTYRAEVRVGRGMRSKRRGSKNTNICKDAIPNLRPAQLSIPQLSQSPSGLRPSSCQTPLRVLARPPMVALRFLA